MTEFRLELQEDRMGKDCKGVWRNVCEWWLIVSDLKNW